MNKQITAAVALGAVFAASVAVVPSTFAAESLLGTVEDVTASDSLIDGKKPNPVIEPADGNGKDVTITYDQAQLKYVGKDAGSANRPGDAAWLGIKVTYPESIKNGGSDQEAAKKVQMWSSDPEKKESIESIVDGRDPYYINLYGGVTKEKLEDAANAGQEILTVAEWHFDWDGDETEDQSFTIKLKVKDVVLQDLDETEVFSPEKAEELFAAYEASQQQTASPSEQQTTEPENPDTADPVATYVILAGVALAGVGVAVAVKRSRR